MAARDAVSNAARETAKTEAQRVRQEAEYKDHQLRAIRQYALKLALKMCPDDVVRTADALTSDAEKLTTFILTGKTPAKRAKSR